MQYLNDLLIFILDLRFISTIYDLQQFVMLIHDLCCDSLDLATTSFMRFLKVSDPSKQLNHKQI